MTSPAEGTTVTDAATGAALNPADVTIGYTWDVQVTFDTTPITNLANAWTALGNTISQQISALTGAVTGMSWTGEAATAAQDAWQNLSFLLSQLPAACQQIADALNSYVTQVQQYIQTVYAQAKAAEITALVNVILDFAGFLLGSLGGEAFGAIGEAVSEALEGLEGTLVNALKAIGGGIGFVANLPFLSGAAFGAALTVAQTVFATWVGDAAENLPTSISASDLAQTAEEGAVGGLIFDGLFRVPDIAELAGFSPPKDLPDPAATGVAPTFDVPAPEITVAPVPTEGPPVLPPLRLGDDFGPLTLSEVLRPTGPPPDLTIRPGGNPDIPGGNVPLSPDQATSVSSSALSEGAVTDSLGTPAPVSVGQHQVETLPAGDPGDGTLADFGVRQVQSPTGPTGSPAIEASGTPRVADQPEISSLGSDAHQPEITPLGATRQQADSVSLSSSDTASTASTHYQESETDSSAASTPTSLSSVSDDLGKPVPATADGVQAAQAATDRPAVPLAQRQEVPDAPQAGSSAASPPREPQTPSPATRSDAPPTDAAEAGSGSVKAAWIENQRPDVRADFENIVKDSGDFHELPLDQQKVVLDQVRQEAGAAFDRAFGKVGPKGENTPAGRRAIKQWQRDYGKIRANVAGKIRFQAQLARWRGRADAELESQLGSAYSRFSDDPPNLAANWFRRRVDAQVEQSLGALRNGKPGDIEDLKAKFDQLSKQLPRQLNRYDRQGNQINQAIHGLDGKLDAAEIAVPDNLRMEWKGELRDGLVARYEQQWGDARTLPAAKIRAMGEQWTSVALDRVSARLDLLKGFDEVAGKFTEKIDHALADYSGDLPERTLTPAYRENVHNIAEDYAGQLRDHLLGDLVEGRPPGTLKDLTEQLDAAARSLPGRLEFEKAVSSLKQQVDEVRSGHVGWWRERAELSYQTAKEIDALAARLRTDLSNGEFSGGDVETAVGRLRELTDQVIESVPARLGELRARALQTGEQPSVVHSDDPHDPRNVEWGAASREADAALDHSLYREQDFLPRIESLRREAQESTEWHEDGFKRVEVKLREFHAELFRRGDGRSLPAELEDVWNRGLDQARSYHDLLMGHAHDADVWVEDQKPRFDQMLNELAGRPSDDQLAEVFGGATDELRVRLFSGAPAKLKTELLARATEKQSAELLARMDEEDIAVFAAARGWRSGHVEFASTDDLPPKAGLSDEAAEELWTKFSGQLRKIYLDDVGLDRGVLDKLGFDQAHAGQRGLDYGVLDKPDDDKPYPNQTGLDRETLVDDLFARERSHQELIEAAYQELAKTSNSLKTKDPASALSQEARARIWKGLADDVRKLMDGKPLATDDPLIGHELDQLGLDPADRHNAAVQYWTDRLPARLGREIAYQRQLPEYENRFEQAIGRFKDAAFSRDEIVDLSDAAIDTARAEYLSDIHDAFVGGRPDEIARIDEALLDRIRFLRDGIEVLDRAGRNFKFASEDFYGVPDDRLKAIADDYRENVGKLYSKILRKITGIFREANETGWLKIEIDHGDVFGAKLDETLYDLQSARDYVRELNLWRSGDASAFGRDQGAGDLTVPVREPDDAPPPHQAPPSRPPSVAGDESLSDHEVDGATAQSAAVSATSESGASGLDAAADGGDRLGADQQVAEAQTMQTELAVPNPPAPYKPQLKPLLPSEAGRIEPASLQPTDELPTAPPELAGSERVLTVPHVDALAPQANFGTLPDLQPAGAETSATTSSALIEAVPGQAAGQPVAAVAPVQSAQQAEVQPDRSIGLPQANFGLLSGQRLAKTQIPPTASSETVPGQVDVTDGAVQAQPVTPEAQQAAQTHLETGTSAGAQRAESAQSAPPDRRAVLVARRDEIANRLLYSAEAGLGPEQATALETELREINSELDQIARLQHLAGLKDAQRLINEKLSNGGLYANSIKALRSNFDANTEKIKSLLLGEHWRLVGQIDDEITKLAGTGAADLNAKISAKSGTDDSLASDLRTAAGDPVRVLVPDGDVILRPADRYVVVDQSGYQFKAAQSPNIQDEEDLFAQSFPVVRGVTVLKEHITVGEDGVARVQIADQFLTMMQWFHGELRQRDLKPVFMLVACNGLKAAIELVRVSGKPVFTVSAGASMHLTPDKRVIVRRLAVTSDSRPVFVDADLVLVKPPRGEHEPELVYLGPDVAEGVRDAVEGLHVSADVRLLAETQGDPPSGEVQWGVQEAGPSAAPADQPNDYQRYTMESQGLRQRPGIASSPDPFFTSIIDTVGEVAHPTYLAGVLRNYSVSLTGPVTEPDVRDFLADRLTSDPDEYADLIVDVSADQVATWLHDGTWNDVLARVAPRLASDFLGINISILTESGYFYDLAQQYELRTVPLLRTGSQNYVALERTAASLGAAAPGIAVEQPPPVAPLGPIELPPELGRVVSATGNMAEALVWTEKIEPYRVIADRERQESVSEVLRGELTLPELRALRELRVYAEELRGRETEVNELGERAASRVRGAVEQVPPWLFGAGAAEQRRNWQAVDALADWERAGRITEITDELHGEAGAAGGAVPEGATLADVLGDWSIEDLARWTGEIVYARVLTGQVYGAVDLEATGEAAAAQAAAARERVLWPPPSFDRPSQAGHGGVPAADDDYLSRADLAEIRAAGEGARAHAQGAGRDEIYQDAARQTAEDRQQELIRQRRDLDR